MYGLNGLDTNPGNVPGATLGVTEGGPPLIWIAAGLIVIWLMLRRK